MYRWEKYVRGLLVYGCYSRISWFGPFQPLACACVCGGEGAVEMAMPYKHVRFADGMTCLCLKGEESVVTGARRTGNALFCL